MFAEFFLALVTVLISVAALRVAYVEGKTEGYSQAQEECDRENHAAPPF